MARFFVIAIVIICLLALCTGCEVRCSAFSTAQSYDRCGRSGECILSAQEYTYKERIKARHPQCFSQQVEK